MDKKYHIIILLLLLLIATSLLNSPGVTDVNVWMRWMDSLEKNGLVKGYEVNRTVYPPLSNALLFLVVQCSRFFHVSLFIALKLSIFFFLLLTCVVFYLWTRRVALCSLLLGSLVLNSVAHAYLDIYYAPFLIYSLWALKERKDTLFALSYTIACLIKWQPLIMAPFIMLYILDARSFSELTGRRIVKIMASIGLPVLLLVSICLLVFNVELIRSFLRGASHTYLSGKALNASWLLTYFLHLYAPDKFGGLVDGLVMPVKTTEIPIIIGPKLAFVFFYGWSFVLFFKSQNTFKNLLIYSVIGYLAYFTFNTSVHENHLFMAAVMALLLFFVDSSQLSLFLVIALMFNVNEYIFYGPYGKGMPFSRWIGVDITILFSLLYIIIFFVVFFQQLNVHRLQPANREGR